MTNAQLAHVLAPYALPRSARVYVYREPDGLVWYTTHDEIERNEFTEALGSVQTNSAGAVIREEGHDDPV